MTEVVEKVGRFTPAEREALDQLAGEFGPVDPYLQNVTSDEHLNSEYGYKHWIKRSLTDALRYWGQYKHAESVDWEVERARRIAEQSEKMKNRKVEVRENMVSGILAGLMPKARRAGVVSFNIDDDYMELVVEDEMRPFAHRKVVWLTYDRRDGTLEASLNDKRFLVEDWTALGGNERPRDQSPALAAVMDYLDGLAEAGKVAQL
jgi:hypothetical protein